jgi:hypothetical protein
MTKIFLNLTNGIQALEKYNLPLDEVNFVRIQSTHCENKAFEKMLLTLDSNFLMWLALGYECVVYDFGARNDTSKAVYYGLEWIRYVLNKRWFNKNTIPYVKGKNVEMVFSTYYSEINSKTKRQLDYYKKFLMTDEIQLSAITSATYIDNQPENYFKILQQYLHHH